MNEQEVLMAIRIAKAMTTWTQSADDCAPWVIGKAYLIRTVTHYRTGRVAAVHPTELVLHDSAWIADTGRWSDALKSGKLNEVEPSFAPVILNRASIIDAEEWTHELPRYQK